MHRFHMNIAIDILFAFQRNMEIKLIFKFIHMDKQKLIILFIIHRIDLLNDEQNIYFLSLFFVSKLAQLLLIQRFVRTQIRRDLKT